MIAKLKISDECLTPFCSITVFDNMAVRGPGNVLFVPESKQYGSIPEYVYGEYPQAKGYLLNYETGEDRITGMLTLHIFGFETGTVAQKIDSDYMDGKSAAETKDIVVGVARDVEKLNSHARLVECEYGLSDDDFANNLRTVAVKFKFNS